MSFMQKLLGVLKEMGEGFTEGADLAKKEQEKQTTVDHHQADRDGFRAWNGDPIVKNFTVIKPASSQ